MKMLSPKLIHFVCSFLLLVFFNSRKSEAQQVEVIKLDKFMEIISQPSEKIAVVNFWTTWCKPCILELPYFLAMDTLSKDSIDLYLVSLDFAEDLERKVIPFVEKRNMQAKTFLLDETKYNDWIDKVEPSWGGAIPATLVLNRTRTNRVFAERDFHSLDELYTFVKRLKN